jgi:bacitracin transport system permease protein
LRIIFSKSLEVVSLFSIFNSEFMKLKNTKINWLVLMGALPSTIVSLFALLPRVTPAGFDLQDMFYRQGMVLTILGPFMFSLMTGYIISREYQERTINQLFSYPVSRVRILAAKLSVVFSLIVITTALSCAGVAVLGFIMSFTQHIGFDTVWMGIRMNIMVCVLSFGTIPIAAALSMVGKSVIPTTVLGVFVTIVTLIGEMGHGMRGILFPWLTPYWPVRELAQGLAENGLNPYVTPAIIILALTFIVSLTFCIGYYSKSEVHSGS